MEAFLVRVNWKEIPMIVRQKLNAAIASTRSIWQQSGIANSNELIGLDICADSLKMLIIDSSAKPFKVKNFANSPLPKNAILKDEIKNREAISTAIRDMIKQANITAKNVAISVPRSLAVIKNININNALLPDEIESRITVEANKLFPELIGDIYLDYAIVGPSKQDSTQLDVIIAVCRKDQIQPFYEIISDAGLIPRIVDINCYALERALIQHHAKRSTDTTALLNLNLNLSTLIVIHNGIMIHAHDDSFDGEHLLAQVQSYLNESRLSKSSIPTNLLSDVIYYAILKDNLISHLRHTIQFVYSSKPDISINQIILSGDCSNIPEIAIFIQNEVGIPTSIANPFESMQFDNTINIDEIKPISSTLMLCAGLALSQLEGKNHDAN